MCGNRDIFVKQVFSTSECVKCHTMNNKLYVSDVGLCVLCLLENNIKTVQNRDRPVPRNWGGGGGEGRILDCRVFWT